MKPLAFLALVACCSSCFTFSDVGDGVESANDVSGEVDQGRLEDVADADVPPGRDMDPPDTRDAAIADTAVDVGPDLANPCPPRSMPSGQSSVCPTNAAASGQSGTPPDRLRVVANDEVVHAAYLSGGGAGILTATWDELEGNPPAGYVYAEPFVNESGPLADDGATSVAIGFSPNSSEPLWAVTREATGCAYLSSGTSSTTITCLGGSVLHAAEVVDSGDEPQFFWFETKDGGISAMRHDSTGRGGAQVLVPWCIDEGAGCLSLDVGEVDSRSTGGPAVLLRGPRGHAFLWDFTQVADDERSDPLQCDCTTEPPLALMDGAAAMRFDEIDVVWDGSMYYLVHQVGSTITVYELDENTGVLGTDVGVIDSGWDFPMMDAAIGSNGRIAVVTASSSLALVHGLAGGEVLLGALGDFLDVGIAVRGDEVAVVMITTTNEFARKVTTLWD